MNNIRDKYAQDFERYENIINYLIKNPDRVSVNRGYLGNLANSLKFISFKNFTRYIKVEANVLEDRIREILEQEKKESVKNLKVKLEKIEDSRKEKENLIDQWVGELI